MANTDTAAGAAWGGRPYHALHFDALKRLADRHSGGYER